MPEAMTQPCAAAETSTARGVRYVVGALLALIALVECGVASVLACLQPAAPQFLYLLCTLALIVSVIAGVRERRRALLAVRAFAIAAAVMLFWASQSTLSGPKIRIAGGMYDLVPSLAGMLLGAVLLPSLLLQRNPDITCNCQ